MPRGRFVAVALFRYGQADDAGLRIRDAFEDGVGVFLGHHDAQNGSHDTQVFAVLAVRTGVAHGQRVQPVLGRERIASVGVAQRDAQDAPGEVAAGLHGLIGDKRLMGPVKGAQPQMDDARCQPATVVAGLFNVGGQTRQ